MPEAKWFSLIGAIDRDKKTLFDIGKLIETGGTYTASQGGELSCFANDLWIMYFNEGVIQVEVSEEMSTSPNGQQKKQ